MDAVYLQLYCISTSICCFVAVDLDECYSWKLTSSLNDCHDNASCDNLLGYFDCVCNVDFKDISTDKHYLGRRCVGRFSDFLANGQSPFSLLSLSVSQITRKWYKVDLQWLTISKSYMIYRITPYSATLNDPYLRFQGHTIIWCWVSQKWDDIYRHSFNGILIGTYTRPTQQCHFEWRWVNLSDLAKYSMTRSVARSLCNSWATSCCSPSPVPKCS